MKTNSLTIALPAKLRRFVDRKIATGAYADPGAYIQALLRDAEKREARERIEALLLEGLRSGPATEMTKQDWEDIRREGMKQLKTWKSKRTS
jgi:antitoxin ParD1/3/4